MLFGSKKWITLSLINNSMISIKCIFMIYTNKSICEKNRLTFFDSVMRFLRNVYRCTKSLTQSALVFNVTVEIVLWWWIHNFRLANIGKVDGLMWLHPIQTRFKAYHHFVDAIYSCWISSLFGEEFMTQNAASVRAESVPFPPGHHINRLRPQYSHFAQRHKFNGS